MTFTATQVCHAFADSGKFLLTKTVREIQWLDSIIHVTQSKNLPKIWQRQVRLQVTEFMFISTLIFPMTLNDKMIYFLENDTTGNVFWSLKISVYVNIDKWDEFLFAMYIFWFYDIGASEKSLSNLLADFGLADIRKCPGVSDKYLRLISLQRRMA